jgi:hypothetical protein
MRLTQLVEAAAKFVEIPPLHQMHDFDKFLRTIQNSIDETTGIGWVLDPYLSWKQKFSQINIDGKILDRIMSGLSSLHEGASESDAYEDEILYSSMIRTYHDHGKVEHQPVKSPTTGREGWKFILKPAWKEARRIADQAVAKYMKEQAQRSRR